jgi:hypothetical protein
MTWKYAWQWNEVLCEPLDPLTEDEAHQRHNRGELYTAYKLTEDGLPSIAVEVRLENDYVGIWDFDALGRQVWHRTLDRFGDRMFMINGTLYGYGDSTEYLLVSDAATMTSRHIQPDGSGRELRVTEDDPEGTESILSLKPGNTLNHYWTEVPEFGEYGAVMSAGIDPRDLADPS